MEDGSVGDPREVAADAKGVLRHKDGRAVAYAPHGPRSRMVGPQEMAASREMEPEKPKRPYRTREMKAD